MIKELVKALRKDKELYYAYQANIAMAFIDEYDRFKADHNKIPNRKEIDKIANNSAKNFLDLLIKY